MPIVKEEGKYYVWTAEELTAILGQEALFSDYYNSTKKWKWETKEYFV
jgi:uncharacterized protein YyaL (SSP411 family)